MNYLKDILWTIEPLIACMETLWYLDLGVTQLMTFRSFVYFLLWVASQHLNFEWTPDTTTLHYQKGGKKNKKQRKAAGARAVYHT